MGRRILVLRAPHQARALSERIRAVGGEPVEAPTIVTVAGDVGRLRGALAELAEGRFAAIGLTSPNGVAAVADHADRPLALGGAAVWAVGPRTAELVRALLGVEVDLVPPEATSASLAEVVPAAPGRVLLPRGDLASSVLADAVTAAGGEPVDVVAYRTVAPTSLPDPVLADLEAGRIDLVAATSASTLRNLVALAGGRRLPPVVAIGPVTGAAGRELGVEVVAEADPHDLDGLVAALARVAPPPPR